MAKFCTNCGFRMEDNAAFCTNCGQPVLQGQPQQQLCPYCGRALIKNDRFCTGCGRPITIQQPVQRQPQEMQPQPQQRVQYQQVPQQPQQSQQKVQYQQTPQVQQPQQIRTAPAARPNPAAQQKKKSGKGVLIALIAVFGSAAVLVVGILGFRKGGWFRSKDEPGKESVVQDDKDGQANLNGRPTTYDGENSIDALLDYADRLEKAGNEEAAALVRSKIPQAAAGEANKKLEELKQENEELQMIEDFNDALRLINAMRGGN